MKYMNRSAMIILAIIFTLFNFSQLQAAEEKGESFLLPEVIEQIDLKTMEDFKQQIDGEISSYIDHKSVQNG